MVALAALLAVRLALHAPVTVPGDGVTQIPIRIETDAAVAPEDVAVTVDAGTASAVVATSGGFAFRWTPPLVVEPIRTRLSVALEGKKAATAQAFVIAGAWHRPPAQITSGALTVPDALVLGQATEAAITVRDAGAAPSLVVSAGMLDPPKKANGVWTAQWHAPAAKYPQIAIIAVRGSDGGISDWAAIRLYAQARVETTAKPDSMVRIRVGDREFGPFRADAKGHGELAVIVPPGVPAASALAIDRMGQTKDSSIPLGVPAFNRVLSTCRAGGMVFVAAAADGSPFRGASFDLTSSAGKLSAPAETAAGVYETTVTGTEALPEGTVKLGAQLRGEAASASSCEVELPPLPPSTITLTAGAPSYRAGSGKKIPLKVELHYPGTRKHAPVALEFLAPGTVTPRKITVSSGLEAQWSPADSFGGQRKATASVTAKSALGTVSADTAIDLVPGPIAKIEGAGDKAPVNADGDSGTRVSLASHDAFGNPIAVPPLELTASAGKTGPLTTTSAGLASFVWTTPHSRRAVDATIGWRDAASGASGSTTLHARGSAARTEIALRGGYLTNLGKVQAPLAAAAFTLRPAMLRRRLRIGLEAGYYASSATSTSILGPVDVKVTATPVLARATFDLVPTGRLYLGAGGGAFNSRVETVSPSTGKAVTASPNPGAGPLFGADLPFGPGRLVLETAFYEATISSSAVKGNVGGLSVTAGYAIPLF